VKKNPKVVAYFNFEQNHPGIIYSLIIGDIKKVGGCGEKGGKMCGCLWEKDCKHTSLARKKKLPISTPPLLEKRNYLSVIYTCVFRYIFWKGAPF
jgi:hypothetical protein